MKLPDCETVLLKRESHALHITLNRVRVRNAMNQKMVRELMACFDTIADNRDIRVVVLRGAGGHFCAGGDINDMLSAHQQTAEGDTDAFYKLNRLFGHMITQINQAPQVVVTVLEGAVMGGGFGLACVSDLAIAHQNARFALPETSLGIVPAQIAPFVVARIGITQTRRLALFNQPLTAQQALQNDLVHILADSDEALEQQLADAIIQVKQCAPEANATTKKLILSVGQMDMEKLLDSAAHSFSHAVTQGEGPEGTQAFVGKRPAHWAQ